MLLNTFASEFSFIEAWFSDQNFKPKEIKDKTIITLAINWCVYIKIRYSVELRDRMFVKTFRLLSFDKTMDKNIAKIELKTSVVNTVKNVISQISFWDLIGNKIADKIKH